MHVTIHLRPGVFRWSVTFWVSFFGFIFGILVFLRDRLIATAYGVYVAFGCWCVVDSSLVTLDRPLAMEYSFFYFFFFYFYLFLFFLSLSLYFISVRAVIFMSYYDVMLLATRYALGHHIIIHEVSGSSLILCANILRHDGRKKKKQIASTLPRCMLPRAASRSGLQKGIRNLPH